VRHQRLPWEELPRLTGRRREPQRLHPRPYVPDRKLREPGCRRYQIWYHNAMDAAALLQEARRRSGLSRRQLAHRGHTSPSTLSAYELGTSIPSVATLTRLLRAAGFEPEASLRPVSATDDQELTQKIEALFSFVDVLPRGHRGPLRYPVFGASKMGSP
jgi:transcriptional regulator with XRE-family HTH domain